MKKRLLSLGTVFTMLLSSATILPEFNTGSIEAVAYTAHTQEEALNWIRSKVGQGVEYKVDNYRYQCVDLIQAYYNYLGVTDSIYYGNAVDYSWVSLPAGWQRVKGGQPQPGDILVYSGNDSNPYGHVAIYESDRVHYHQNFNSHSYVEKVTYAYNGLTNAYWGYIRPDFVSPHVHNYSYQVKVTKEATCTESGTRVSTCSCGDSKTETIPAKGHSYVNTVHRMTTKEDGYTDHKCNVCGYSYVSDKVSKPVLNEDGWYYSTLLPADVNANDFTIEYNNTYEKTQKDSPGTGWKKGEVIKNEWQNKGSTYTSEQDLPTSDARILVSSQYYHFCGPNAGNSSNYEMRDQFVHWDSINANQVTAEYVGLDEGHPYYYLYKDGAKLFCQSGVTCDGNWGTHGKRNCTWYKQNTYQDREKIELYKYTKESGWTSAKDSSATSVRMRFKSNKVPVLPSPEITAITDTNAAKIGWEPVEGAEKYAVTVNVNGKWTAVEKVTDTSYILRGLKANTSYKIAVIPMFNGEWNTDFSNAITITTKAEVAVTSYPEIMSIVKNKQFHQFKIEWDAVEGAEKYGVAVLLNSKWKVVDQNIPANITTFTSPKLKAGQTYTVAVCAKVNGKWITEKINSRAASITVV